jgi:hypothetical protein
MTASGPWRTGWLLVSCPLSGVKQTRRLWQGMSASDPKRTLTGFQEIAELLLNLDASRRRRVGILRRAPPLLPRSITQWVRPTIETWYIAPCRPQDAMRIE